MCSSDLNRKECKMILAETERLILRRYRQEDLQDLYEYLSDQEVVEYEPYKPLTFDETKKISSGGSAQMK